MFNTSMKKMNIVMIAAVIIGLLLTGCGDTNTTAFQRTTPETFQADTGYFKPDRMRARIGFEKGKEKFRLDETPVDDTCFFYLKGKKQIKILPQLSGDIGLYTYLRFQSPNGNNPIDLSIQVHGKNGGREVFRIVNTTVSQPLFKGISLSEGEQLLFKFKGRGAVFFTHPILYKKTPAAQQRNIIFIALDTLRSDQIGAKVGDVSLTPNIDRFIRDGVYFSNAVAQTSWTMPSFMSLFTGLYEYNHETGIKNPLGLDKPALVEALRKEFITFGYHGGKVMDSRWGFSRGFDYYKYFKQAGALYPKGGRSLFQKAAELLDTSPFPHLFLFLHTYQVHAPYTPPEEFLTQLNPDPVHKKLEIINFNEPAKTYQPVEADLKHSYKELYQAEILAFDAYFGDFVAYLKTKGLYDNAMIVFMSDHGEEFFEHKGWGHSHALYDELVKAPVIIKFPGNAYKGRTVKNVVGVIDILPTVLSYYRIPYETAGLDGRNLMTLVEKGGKRRPEYVVSSISTGRYFDAAPTRVAVCYRHYKLVYNHPLSDTDREYYKGYVPPPDVPMFQLFDLAADPGETKNIAASRPDIKNKIMPFLLETVKQVKKKLAAGAQKNKPLEKEVEEQLKSLGYL